MAYSFQFRFLNNVNTEELTQVFNLSYSEPHTPTSYTKEMLLAKIKSESISLSNSIGVYANKKLVGFILHAKLNRQLYNRVTAVLPEFRGNQLTRKMYDYALPILRSFDTKAISAEVSQQQEHLNKIYRRLGFKKWRTLTSLKGTLQPSKKLDLSLEQTTITPMKYYEYLIYFAEKDILPAWSSSDYFIKENQHELVLNKAVLQGQTIGYIVVDQKQHIIHQLWVKEPHRRKGLATLMINNALGTKKNFVAPNLDTQNFGIHAFFKSIGGKEYLTQTEMELYL